MRCERILLPQKNAPTRRKGSQTRCHIVPLGFSFANSSAGASSDRGNKINMETITSLRALQSHADDYLTDRDRIAATRLCTKAEDLPVARQLKELAAERMSQVNNNRAIVPCVPSRDVIGGEM